MSTSKTDLEIYLLAGKIFSEITDDLQEAHYTSKQGSLTVNWSQEQTYNAWAQSETVPGGAPIHKIVLNYELVRQIYRDSEQFCEFAQDPDFLNLVRSMPSGSMPHPLLPETFTKEDCVNNMFFAALTWIYFHELGHLTQEHGFLRCELNSDSNIISIQELEANANKTLTERESIISHATELAADCEATVMCLCELIRQFTSEELVGTKDEGQGLIGCSYLLICSLSCVFYRFNGGQMMVANPIPTGSHPNAIFRLECAVPQFFETLDMFKDKIGLRESRGDLISLTKQAADLGAMFWYFLHSDRSVKLPDMVIKGLLQRSEFKEYAQKIINAWDEVLPGIRETRHFGPSFGILDFGEPYRQYVFGTQQ